MKVKQSSCVEDVLASSGVFAGCNQPHTPLEPVICLFWLAYLS